MIEYQQDYATYRANDALGSTDVKNLCKSVRHFLDGRHKPLSTAALKLGQLIHTLILEPDDFDNHYLIYPHTLGTSRRSLKYKEFAAKHFSKIVLLQKEFENITEIIKQFEASPLKQYFEGGWSEVSLFGELEGIPVKGRLDYLYKNKKMILDIKTIASIDRWQHSMVDYGYHIQAALYQHLLKEELGLKYSDIRMCFILIEKNTNYLAVREIEEDSLRIAEDQIKEAFIEYKKYLSNSLPRRDILPYSLLPLKSGLPLWYKNKIEGNNHESHI